MQRSRAIVGLVFLIFFVISFLTNILGPLVPDIISAFSLSLTLAGFLPFSFFVAYGVMSVPAGTLVERRGERVVMAASFAAACAGAALFALVPSYAVAIGSLFLIGLGMAALQVAINPLLRVAGGEEHFAFYSVFAQLVFGLASFLSPRVYTYLVQGLETDPGRNALLAALARVVPKGLPWVSLYWVFALVTLAMVVVMATARLPRVELKEDERAGAWATYRALLRQRVVVLYFLGIFAYVGSEQGIANWISEFLRSYHGFDPTTTGASAVSWFWGLMTAGCLLGMGLLKLFDSRLVLRAFAAAALATLTVALFGDARASLYAFPALGFCLSVMWSIVFSLGLNSLPSHHGALSGILCTGIVGGAVVPLVVGWLGDLLGGLRGGMVVLYATLAYVLSVGFWARPLVPNETSWRRRRGAVAAALALLGLSATPGRAEPPAPFPWPGGARAAVVLTYDDGMDTHLDHAAPDLDAAGMRGTFFVPGHSESLAKRLPQWRALAARGHELANHAIFHPCLRRPPGQKEREWVKPEWALEGYTKERIRAEAAAMSTTLLAIDGEAARTFAYNCCDTTAGGEPYVDALRPLFLAARAGEDRIVENVRELDPMLVPSWAAEGVDGAQLVAFARRARDAGGLAVFQFHGIGGQWISVSREAHRELLAWLGDHRAEVWTDTFRRVMAHVESERRR